MAVINFIIPIKKPQMIVDRTGFKKLLSRTLASVDAQAGDKKIWIAASPDTPLPKLPENTRVVEVPETGVDVSKAENRADYYRLVRADKGARVRAAIANVTNNRDYVMVVDDDDILHRGLGAFVHETNVASYLITKGFMHNVDTGELFRMDDFNQSCGTSVITFRGLYRYRGKPSEVPSEQTIAELGSHLILPKKIADRGWPLVEVPFRAAIYSTGNANATQRVIREKFGARSTAEYSRALADLSVTREERAYIRKEFGLAPRLRD